MSLGGPVVSVNFNYAEEREAGSYVTRVTEQPNLGYDLSLTIKVDDTYVCGGPNIGPAELGDRFPLYLLDTIPAVIDGRCKDIPEFPALTPEHDIVLVTIEVTYLGLHEVDSERIEIVYSAVKRGALDPEKRLSHEEVVEVPKRDWCLAVLEGVTEFRDIVLEVDDRVAVDRDFERLEERLAEVGTMVAQEYNLKESELYF